MRKFIRRLLGWDCCGEWTQWQTYEGTYSRKPSFLMQIICYESEDIVFTKRWQERTCTICGKIQQRDLEV